MKLHLPTCTCISFPSKNCSIDNLLLLENHMYVQVVSQELLFVRYERVVSLIPYFGGGGGGLKFM